MKRYCYTYLAIIFLAMTQLPLAWAQGYHHQPIAAELFKAMQAGNTFNKHAPVPKERLRLLTVQYIDFAGDTQTGELVVLDACADKVLVLFKALYEQGFPIAKMRLMHHYQGDDVQATTDNNTSCYNCRVIAGSSVLSLHAYGAAIDINPVQNPYVRINEDQGTALYEPTAGIQYANRRLARLGKDYRKGMAEAVVDIFARHGFYWWGGDWDTPMDYQHFQLSRSMTKLYVAMPPQIAKETFHKATDYFNKHQKPIEQVLSQQLAKAFSKKCALVAYYQEDPERFNAVLSKLTKG